MADHSKPNSTHTEHADPTPDHEGALLSVLTLASLYSTTVEAFGLIRAAGKWSHDEQLLLTRLGIQQARLLTWGDALGIASPPKSVTTSAVPKHPSAAYPDLTEPTFFTPRDPRLDEEGVREAVEGALNAIVDRSSHLTREEMMDKFGLKPPKKLTGHVYQPALDTTRLEGFREKYELLKEVAETYAGLQTTQRSASITLPSAWIISDGVRFAEFLRLTQEKIDSLVELLGVKDAVDRGLKMDIRGFGWHLTADRTRIAQDVSKLRLIMEACEGDYPEYLGAVDQALVNIDREERERYMPSPFAKPKPAPAAAPVAPANSSPAFTKAVEGSNGSANGSGHTAGHQAHAAGAKRPSIFGRLFRKSSSQVPKSNHHRASTPSNLNPTTQLPDRSLSDAGPHDPRYDEHHDEEPLVRERSKSVGDIYDLGEYQKAGGEHGEELGRVETYATVSAGSEDGGGGEVGKMISRHDQYRGIGRVETREVR
ncbi:hypothetical protein B0A48_17459 [Cryoendolithus antarcticus]|uniref:Prion-inhibition and propagation HeLo domain-containing protein n=1 Tax=Cryoendolithus antarcticus TaxID=1507870 RepID=A0A1V8SCM8_9PEZI|nr:hypothetical protein B0A48_17459 [Cryoendolithus antarcticus]